MTILLMYVSSVRQAAKIPIVKEISETRLDAPADPDISTLFVTYFTLSLISLYPTAAHRASHSSRIPDTESLANSRPWEMTEAPRTPGTAGGLKSPTTPRTMAFNTLSKNGKTPKKGKAPERNTNEQLPLRHHISMGDETYIGPNGR